MALTLSDRRGAQSRRRHLRGRFRYGNEAPIEGRACLRANAGTAREILLILLYMICLYNICA